MKLCVCVCVERVLEIFFFNVFENAPGTILHNPNENIPRDQDEFHFDELIYC